MQKLTFGGQLRVLLATGISKPSTYYFSGEHIQDSGYPGYAICRGIIMIAEYGVRHLLYELHISKLEATPAVEKIPYSSINKGITFILKG